MTTETLDEFTRDYIACALWSSNDESRKDGGDPLDRNYSVEDIAPECLERMKADCAKFQAEAPWLVDIDSYPPSPGHDFWLTRNGHGAGFWDGDWPEPFATKLDDLAKSFGSFELYVGDNNQIYGA